MGEHCIVKLNKHANSQLTFSRHSRYNLNTDSYEVRNTTSNASFSP